MQVLLGRLWVGNVCGRYVQSSLRRSGVVNRPRQDCACTQLDSELTCLCERLAQDSTSTERFSRNWPENGHAKIGLQLWKCLRWLGKLRTQVSNFQNSLYTV